MDRVRESYQRLHPRLWRSLLIYCGDATMADEVEIDTFTRAATRAATGTANLAATGTVEGGRRAEVDDEEADDFDIGVWCAAFARASTARTGEREPAGSGGEPPSITLIDASAPPLVELIEAFNALLDTPPGSPLKTPPEPSIDAPPEAELNPTLGMVPDRRRAIAVLRAVAELTPDEIADVLSVPPEKLADESGEAIPVLPARQLEQIHNVEPPDLWPRIVTRAAPPSTLGRFQRRSITGVASVLLLVAASAGLYWLAVPTGSVSARPATRLQPGLDELTDGENGGVDDPAADREQIVDPGRLGAASLAGSTGPAQPLVLTAGENGAAIYDLRLPSGERFRLSLPTRLQAELDRFFPQAPPGVIHVTGPGQTDLRIAFTFCAGQHALAQNRSGSLVGRTGGTRAAMRFCRPDELLVTTVTTDLDLDDEELQAFDLRPVELDTAYEQHRNRFMATPTFTGPVRIGSVIVNAIGPHHISAVDADDLSERWTYPASPDGSRDVRLLAPSIAGPRQGLSGVHDDAEGVWLAELGRGIVNLDPATGGRRWSVELAGNPDGVWGAPGHPWFVWSSFTGEGDNRPPVLHRVEPDTGSVLWRADGRSGADWGWNPMATTDDQVFVADVYADPDTSSNGAGSMVSAYGIDDGELDFAVPIDAPEGIWTDAWLIQVLTVDDQTMLLSLTTHGLLSRIDLPVGELRWSSRVNPGVVQGPVQTGDGTWAMRVQASPTGPYYLDVGTGARLANVELPAPPPECETRYGPLASVSLGQPDEVDDAPDPNDVTPPTGCVVVAESQSLQIWNHGFWPMTLTFADRQERVGPDEHVELQSVGRTLPVGPNIVDVEPYEDLTVWTMAADASPTAGLRRTAKSFGPVEVGMTVAEASQVLGLDLALISFDTSRGCMVVTGDPYSPLFRTGAAAAGLIITAIDPPVELDPGDVACGR